MTTKKAAETTATTEVAEVTEQKAVVSIPKLDLEELGLGGLSKEELRSLSGLDAVDSSDISVPYAKMIAKITKDTKGMKIGDFVLPSGKIYSLVEDGEVIPNFSILNVQPIRTYFPQPFKAGSTFICRSFDDKVGAPDGEYAGRSCKKCEFSQFGDDGSAPPCRGQYLLLCSANGELFQLILAGINMKPFRKFLSSQIYSNLGKVYNIMGALNLKVTGVLQDTDNGPFPYLSFNIDEANPTKPVNELKESIETLKSYQEFATQHIMDSTTVMADEMETTADESAPIMDVAKENDAAF